VTVDYTGLSLVAPPGSKETSHFIRAALTWVDVEAWKEYVVNTLLAA